MLHDAEFIVSESCVIAKAFLALVLEVIGFQSLFWCKKEMDKVKFLVVPGGFWEDSGRVVQFRSKL
jgi:hypothetical protein